MECKPEPAHEWIFLSFTLAQALHLAPRKVRICRKCLLIQVREYPLARPHEWHETADDTNYLFG